MDIRRRYLPQELTTIPPAHEGFLLPFNSEQHPVRISQGYNGPWSHRAFLLGTSQRLADYRYSLDFALPFGTEILAARDGQVFGLQDDLETFYDWNDFMTGMHTPANFILLQHDDTLYSVYYHLAPNSFRVQERAFVRKGQSLAQTGRSGWIGSRPHLHFAVYAFEAPQTQTFPVNFENYSGSLEHSALFPENSYP